MRKLFFTVTIMAVLLFSFGCGERKMEEMSPEAKQAIKDITASSTKRVKADELDAHIADTLAMAEKFSIDFPEVSKDEWDYASFYVYFANRKYDEATVKGEEFLTNHPDSKKTLQFMMPFAYAYYNLKNYEKAAMNYNRIVTDYPDSPNVELAMFNAAVNYDKFGAKDAAMVLLERVVTEYSSSRWASSSNQYLAIMHLDAGDFQKAAKCAMEYLQSSGGFYFNNPKDLRNSKIVGIVQGYAKQVKLPDEKLFSAALMAIYYSKAYDMKTRKRDDGLRNTAIFTLGKLLDKAGNAPYAVPAAYVYASLGSYANLSTEKVLGIVKKWENIATGTYPQKFFSLKLGLLVDTDEIEAAMKAFREAKAEWKSVGAATSFSGILMRKDKYAYAVEVASKGLEISPNDSGLKKVFDQCSLVGKVAPEISGENFLTGNPIKLSDLKGKVVLLDFWASWCGPCIGEIPNMVKVYDKYKAQGFEIFGVSLDRENIEGKLMKFLEDKGMTWPQIYEGLYWNVTSRPDYKFSGIPFMVLIGKDGKIALINKRGAALEPAVKELLGIK